MHNMFSSQIYPPWIYEKEHQKVDRDSLVMSLEPFAAVLAVSVLLVHP